ncbi:hypothetical protein [Agaribacter flavus]|uniref:Uncharacterized protein n=1 Tax=Agaribacter flavus TaxID=1902781 RepID=A0ABV7FRF3_9ALTE
MSQLNCEARSIGAKKRMGWAFPFVNFAGRGFRFNLGARPRSAWDFNAKIHDMMFIVNDLKFSLPPTREPKERSRLAKADYVFRRLSEQIDKLPAEVFYNNLSKIVFLGKDQSDFISADGFSNVIHAEELSIENKHFMIPWSEIPQEEQRAIDASAQQRAKQTFSDNSLDEIRKIYHIDTRLKERKRANKIKVKETPKQRDKRVIEDIFCEYKYNTLSSVDSVDWRSWASKKLGEAWAKAMAL